MQNRFSIGSPSCEAVWRTRSSADATITSPSCASCSACLWHMAVDTWMASAVRRGYRVMRTTACWMTSSSTRINRYERAQSTRKAPNNRSRSDVLRLPSQCRLARALAISATVSIEIWIRWPLTLAVVSRTHTLPHSYTYRFTSALESKEVQHH